jgi:hypothetical protein
MTSKIKNRLQKMHFQKHITRRTEVEKNEDTKYYEELYRKRTIELLGYANENIYETARGSI